MNWFQIGPLPKDMIIGTYDLKLVALSYIIAVLASYVALDLVGRLRVEKHPKIKKYWLFGGAFAMGAGIWSMHFIGMLAFIMPMEMHYELSWTLASLVVAIIVSGFALFLLRNEGQSVHKLIVGGILIGLGIATMHYMGMEGMTNQMMIHYIPSWFFLSIVIAILAAEAALWLALQSVYGSTKRQFYFKLVSAFVMGIAICGMHYTGMAAAVFTPMAGHHLEKVVPIPPTLLAFFIAGITTLIISLALTVSTYYKQMVNAVQNEKEFLNAMLDNLEDGIIACDAKGQITVFNNALQNNVVYNKPGSHIEQLSDYFELYALDSMTPLNGDDLPLNCALKGERIHAKELLMKFPNGVLRNVIIDGQTIVDAHGKKLGAVIVIHDITELKQTEKMKREFVSIVSHELRTPLTSIRGSLGLILGGTVGSFSEKAHKLLEIANKNCERLLLLINDILDVEKIRAGKMDFNLKSLDIMQLVKDAIASNKMYGDKYGVSIALEESFYHCDVYADPDRLMQVLTNLISNAVKFSPKNGVVRLAITKSDDEHVRVSVIDKGAGIPKEFQSRIFQQFSQADSSSSRCKGGTGLGLSICKAIVEKLDGTLSFTSNSNGSSSGSVFYFDLPIYKESQEVISSETSESHPVKFLICEDDEDQAKYLALLLQGAGYETDLAFTVGQAKNLLANNQYKALLLDLILPDQDGISFIRELRNSKDTRRLPIIVLSIIAETGHSIIEETGSNIINGDAFSVVDWLDKPINFEKLMQSIAHIKDSTGNRPLVLHIEDDLDTQHVLATLLEKEAKVVAVGSIKETKQILRDKSFDLVILDLLLPDGNGAEILPLLAEYKLPVIVYSATELDQEYSQYVIDALVKSKIDNQQLLHKIKGLFSDFSGEYKHV